MKNTHTSADMNADINSEKASFDALFITPHFIGPVHWNTESRRSLFAGMQLFEPIPGFAPGALHSLTPTLSGRDVRPQAEGASVLLAAFEADMQYARR